MKYWANSSRVARLGSIIAGIVAAVAMSSAEAKPRIAPAQKYQPAAVKGAPAGYAKAVKVAVGSDLGKAFSVTNNASCSKKCNVNKACQGFVVKMLPGPKGNLICQLKSSVKKGSKVPASSKTGSFFVKSNMRGLVLPLSKPAAGRR